MQVVNLVEKFSKFKEHFTPKLVSELNDFQVKLVKLKGEFVWHHHDAEDEMFLVVKGALHMKYRDAQNKEQEKVINPGEFVIVHHGVEHMPYALEETHMVLFELGSTLNTGTTQSERTVASPQWI